MIFIFFRTAKVGGKIKSKKLKVKNSFKKPLICQIIPITNQNTAQRVSRKGAVSCVMF